MACVLVVDDRAENHATLGSVLTQRGHAVQSATNVAEARAKARTLAIDVVLAEVRMDAEDDGLRLLRIVKNEIPHLAVVLYAACPRVADAVLAMKLGAADYLEFPIDPDSLALVIEKALERPRGAVIRRGAAHESPTRERQVVMASPAMAGIFEWVGRIGRTDITTLVSGETGTGKELVARALHSAGHRRVRPFVAVNCGAIPDTLFEAELFGYAKGAFTGALTDKPGLAEEAHGGTLFLDEIGELPAAMQVRLLRFLETGELRRLGETKTRNVDVRIVAATNRLLGVEVAEGRFRSDLYFRLNVATCHIPPLRERLEDLDGLIEVMLPQCAQQTSSHVRRLTDGALAMLRAHSWPGNIRELRNVLEYSMSLATTDSITEHDVASALGTARASEHSAPVDSGTGERERLLASLQSHRWNIGRTAASLGVSRSTLWRRLKKYGVG